MKGKFSKRVLGLFTVLLLFLLSWVSLAGENFYTQLVSWIQISDNKVGTQQASLVGALNTEGWIYTTEGVKGTQASGTLVPILRSTPESGLCVGECDGAEGTSGASQFRKGGEVVDTPSVASSTVELSDTSSTSKQLEPIVVVSASSTTPGETVMEEATTTERPLKSTEQQSSNDKNRGISASNDTQTNTPDSDVSTTSSSTIATTSPVEEIEDPAKNPFEIFIQSLSSVLSIVEGRLGIGMQPLVDFMVSVNGWLFTNKGIIVGNTDQFMGLGLTPEGICLGSCDFNFDQITANADKDLSIIDTSSIANSSILQAATTSTSSTSTLLAGRATSTVEHHATTSSSLQEENGNANTSEFGTSSQQVGVATSTVPSFNDTPQETSTSSVSTSTDPTEEPLVTLSPDTSSSTSVETTTATSSEDTLTAPIQEVTSTSTNNAANNPDALSESSEKDEIASSTNI